MLRLYRYVTLCLWIKNFKVKKIKFLVRSQNFQMITLQPYNKSFLLPIKKIKIKKFLASYLITGNFVYYFQIHCQMKLFFFWLTDNTSKRTYSICYEMY